MKVPYFDLEIQYKKIQKEIENAISSVIKDFAFIRGKYVEEFEKEFAKIQGVKYAIGVGNGTDALYIALKTLGIGVGDEVITAANSFIASSEAITMTGAKVVFADCDKDTYCIDAKDIERKITGKTKAIIPVHLYGQIADMLFISEIAKKNNVFLVEDSAQAVLASYMGQMAGSFGQFATMSFYPGKNLGAYGDAGAILTNDAGLYKKAKMFANHGRINKYDHEFEGMNSRMDGIQGAILNVKLRYIKQWTEKRKKIASLYHEVLKEVDQIVLPYSNPKSDHVYHIFPIRVKSEDRDVLMDYLKKNNIGVGIHYPIALPMLKAYEYLNHKSEDFMYSCKYANELISLPIYPELEEEQILFVTEKIKSFFASK